MKAKSFIFWLAVGVSVLMAAGCREEPHITSTVTPFQTGVFTPYQTITPSRTAIQVLITRPTLTPIPSSTATPRTHVVKAGEDMGGIAMRYRVPVKDLMNANPTVNPRLMKIGTVLIIPGEAVSAAPAAQVTPTLQPVLVEAVNCNSDPGGGAWCFTRVRNQSGTALINVTILVHLVDANGKEIFRQKLSLPLDLLPAESTMPLAVFFAPPLPVVFQASAEVESALPANAAGEHYPPVLVQDSKIIIAADGISAEASGRAALVDKKGEASQLMILAAAYSSSGAVIGLRRWEITLPVQANQPLDFRFQVYSQSGPVARVELFAEARR